MPRSKKGSYATECLSARAEPIKPKTAWAIHNPRYGSHGYTTSSYIDKMQNEPAVRRSANGVDHAVVPIEALS